MAKRTVKRKPISNDEYNKTYGTHPLTDLILQTGARIAEIKRIIDEYNGVTKYIDIHTKKSGTGTNRIYLTDNAIKSIGKLNHLKNVEIRTLQRIVKKVSTNLNIPFTPHNLRATFCSRILENGGDIISAQHLMNHASIVTTALYVQFNESRLSATSDLANTPETIEGYTLPEALNEIAKLRIKIRRLELHAKN